MSLDLFFIQIHFFRPIFSRPRWYGKLGPDRWGEGTIRMWWAGPVGVLVVM